jgi:hypothetical protein
LLNVRFTLLSRSLWFLPHNQGSLCQIAMPSFILCCIHIDASVCMSWQLKLSFLYSNHNILLRYNCFLVNDRVRFFLLCFSHEKGWKVAVVKMYSAATVEWCACQLVCIWIKLSLLCWLWMHTIKMDLRCYLKQALHLPVAIEMFISITKLIRISELSYQT